MTRVLTTKRILLALLIVATLVSSFLIYKNNFQPKVVLAQNTTYYLPGQNDDCNWILQAENNLRNIPGETTEIRIGIPAAQTLGYISGRVEVGPHNTLILAFIPPGPKTNKIPVILTADYSEKSLPIDFVRFRWVQSSAITILVFSNKDACIASRVRK
jgi:hypothetical protein